MSGGKFDALYKKLNLAQRQAVDSIDGPVMVMAGPGTGKTQVLILRIANILRLTDTPPDAILALTFTQAAAQNMRRRLVEIIGPAAYRLAINTFHGFCNTIIKNYPDDFPRIVGSRELSPAEQLTVLQELVRAGRFKTLRPLGDPDYYLTDIRQAIEHLKRENLTPADFKKEIQRVGGDKKYLDRNRELWKIYQSYEDWLKKFRRYDFGDMIIEAVRTLETNKDLRLTLQEEYHYFLADEHQDANGAQNKLLELLSGYHESPNLFLVGDEKQAIFQFQGASLDNFNYFRKLFPQAKLIALTRNYRSSQTILDSAQSLLPGPVKLRAVKTGKNKIKIYSFPQIADEHRFLAEDIASRLKRGERAEEIAVLYRLNRESEKIAAALERRGISYTLLSDDNILTDREIQKLLLILRSLDDFNNERLAKEFLVLDVFNIPPPAIFDYLGRGRLHPAVKKALAQRERWWSLSQNTTPTRLLEIILKESDLLGRLLAQDDAVSRLEKIRTLFSVVGEMLEKEPNLAWRDILARLAIHETRNLPIKNRLYCPRPGVRLLTAHKAKGLEFETVYITGAFDGHWGGRRPRSLLRLPSRGHDELLPLGLNTIEDERRLFYVALTRARHETIITYPRRTEDGRELLPSQFVEEINPRFKEMTEVSSAGDPAEFMKPRIPMGPSLTDVQFIRALFRQRGFSVTHLNNYLACPWRYFFVNLLRLPQTPSLSALYGTAAHEALREFFSDAQRTKKNLLAGFSRALDKLALTANEKERLWAKGRKTLAGYHDHYRGTFAAPALTELNIAGVELTAGLRLTGKIDKIEKDGRVVDYKTCRPKNDPNYKRQLVFYKLLLNHYAGGRYKMTTGEIDFIEPDAKGRYQKQKFEITTEEVEALKDLIKKTAAEIITLAFWSRTCDRKDCHYCDLRRMMKF